MEFRYLNAFFHTAENKSFTLAARQLGVAQSAVSRQIKLLEESLHVQLLIRSKKSVVLTPEGEQLFLQVRNFRNWGQQQFEVTEFPLRVVSMTGVLESWLSERLMQASSLPSLSIDTARSEEIRAHLKQGVYDVAFTIEKIENEYYSARKIYEEEFCLVSKKPVEMSALDQHTWIYSESASHLKKLTSKRPKKMLKVSSLRLVLRFVKAGKGIAVLPKHIADLEKGGLHKQILPKKKGSVYVSVLNYEVTPKRLREFLKLL